MANYSRLKYIEGSKLCSNSETQINEDELESLEAELRKLKSQRSAFVGLCATLLRGISLQTTQPASAAAILAAAKADYEQLLKIL